MLDDGPGISEIDRQRVFERFVRLDRSRAHIASSPAHGRGGAGLGLSIVRAFVTNHGGAAPRPGWKRTIAE